MSEPLFSIINGDKRFPKSVGVTPSGDMDSRHWTMLIGDEAGRDEIADGLELLAAAVRGRYNDPD